MFPPYILEKSTTIYSVYTGGSAFCIEQSTTLFSDRSAYNLYAKNSSFITSTFEHI